MPTQIKMWACQYRCGHVRSKQAAIFTHEKTCFSNPVRHACRTCQYFSREDEWSICEHPTEDIVFDDKFRFDCQFWEKKQDADGGKS